MPARVAINGLGRIGRAALRSLVEEPSGGLDLVAVNDVAPPDNLAYLLRYDSVYGRMGAKKPRPTAIAASSGSPRTRSRPPTSSPTRARPSST